MVVLISTLPVDPYEWLPLTVNGPPSAPVTVPGELEPSPQATVARNSSAVALSSGSVKVATVLVKFKPSAALIDEPAPLIGASASGANENGGRPAVARSKLWSRAVVPTFWTRY